MVPSAISWPTRDVSPVAVIVTRGREESEVVVRQRTSQTVMFTSSTQRFVSKNGEWGICFTGDGLVSGP